MGAMAPPVLALLVAGSLHLAIEAPRPADVLRVLAAATEAMGDVYLFSAPEDEPTVCDVPYYYDRLAPEPGPAVAPRVTYDWRSPIVFDRP